MHNPESIQPRISIDSQFFTPAVEIDVNAPACKKVLEAFGVPFHGIRDTTIYISSATPPPEEKDYSLLGPERVRIVTPIFRSHSTDGVSIYPDNIDLSNEEHPTYSQALVEELSYYADAIVLGEEGLVNEQKKAETTIAMRKSVPAIMKTVGAGVLAGIGEYFTSKYNIIPRPASLIVAGLGTAVTGYFGYWKARTDIFTEKMRNDIFNLWPIDKRARNRGEEYREYIEKGEFPEIVSFKRVE